MENGHPMTPLKLKGGIINNLKFRGVQISKTTHYSLLKYMFVDFYDYFVIVYIIMCIITHCPQSLAPAKRKVLPLFS